RNSPPGTHPDDERGPSDSITGGGREHRGDGPNGASVAGAVPGAWLQRLWDHPIPEDWPGDSFEAIESSRFSQAEPDSEADRGGESRGAAASAALRLGQSAGPKQN